MDTSEDSEDYFGSEAFIFKLFEIFAGILTCCVFWIIIFPEIPLAAAIRGLFEDTGGFIIITTELLITTTLPKLRAYFPSVLVDLLIYLVRELKKVFK